jgi:hypothetical protein
MAAMIVAVDAVGTGSLDVSGQIIFFDRCHRSIFPLAIA